MSVGFLEESEGVRSMSRLAIAWYAVLATAVVGTICYGAVKRQFGAEMVIALGGVLLTLVAKGAVAIINRNGGSDDTK